MVDQLKPFVEAVTVCGGEHRFDEAISGELVPTVSHVLAPEETHFDRFSWSKLKTRSRTEMFSNGLSKPIAVTLLYLVLNNNRMGSMDGS